MYDDQEYDHEQPAAPAAPVMPVMPTVLRDSLGIVYDTKRVDGYGTTHYTRHKAQGTGGGPAQWSDEHDCNPICGCHLSAKCLGCNVCMRCDGCYCNERDYW